MRIEFELSSTDLPPDREEVIADNLGVQTDGLNAALNRVGKAAVMEYLQMLYERGVPAKADEVLQERLYHLIEHYFISHLPLESEIQSIFQVTSTKSRSLLKNTRSRYRAAIGQQIDNSVRNALSSAKKVKEKHRLVIQSANVLDEINEVVSKLGPTLPKLTSSRGYASMYDCSTDTFNLLKKHYGV